MVKGIEFSIHYATDQTVPLRLMVNPLNYRTGLPTSKAFSSAQVKFSVLFRNNLFSFLFATGTANVNFSTNFQLFDMRVVTQQLSSKQPNLGLTQEFGPTAFSASFERYRQSGVNEIAQALERQVR